MDQRRHQIDMMLDHHADQIIGFGIVHFRIAVEFVVGARAVLRDGGADAGGMRINIGAGKRAFLGPVVGPPQRQKAGFPALCASSKAA